MHQQQKPITPIVSKAIPNNNYTEQQLPPTAQKSKHSSNHEQTNEDYVFDKMNIVPLSETKSTISKKPNNIPDLLSPALTEISNITLSPAIHQLAFTQKPNFVQEKVQPAVPKLYEYCPITSQQIFREVKYDFQ